MPEHQPQPAFSGEAVELAAERAEVYGRDALSSARAALSYALTSQDMREIALHGEVLEILKQGLPPYY